MDKFRDKTLSHIPRTNKRSNLINGFNAVILAGTMNNMSYLTTLNYPEYPRTRICLNCWNRKQKWVPVVQFIKKCDPMPFAKKWCRTHSAQCGRPMNTYMRHGPKLRIFCALNIASRKLIAFPHTCLFDKVAPRILLSISTILIKWHETGARWIPMLNYFI